MNADAQKNDALNCARALRVLAGFGQAPLAPDQPAAQRLLSEAEELLRAADREALMQGLKQWIRSNSPRLDPRHLDFQIRR